MKALVIARMNIHRLTRDKTAVFFVFVFPFLIILALGATFGNASTPKLGVVSVGSGPLGNELVRRLDGVDGLDTRTYDDVDSLRGAVERGAVEGGLVIPAGYDRRVRAGATVPLSYLARPSGSGQDLRLTVTAAVDAEEVQLQAARFAVSEGTAPTLDLGLATSRRIAAATPGVVVRVRTAGATGASIGSFDQGAAQELVLFMFITSLSASAMLIESRRLGCSRRMLASPTRARTIVVGEMLGRYGIAALQGALIVGGTLVVFGVNWGNPLTTAVTIALLALVATGAAMLLGSTLRNAQQAGGLGVFVGLVLGALGGAMVPLEIFPPFMARVAHLTPQAWAIEALNASAATHATLLDVAGKLGVLACYAAGLLGLATILFRRKLTESPA
ncbi:MAG: ABC transporter permease [Actinomycetota bacterium]